jgi:hypothetical protein
MRTIRSFAVIAIAAITFAMRAPIAGAQIPIQKISVTISEPVEVPHLVLPIGTYIFEALENGHVTRILSADESHIYTTLLTQPEERREPADIPLVTLKETAKGAMPRIDCWFFGGESIGNEFLYPGTIGEGKTDSKLNAYTIDAGHVVAVAAEDAVEFPEYIGMHVERAVVGSSVATGRFFRANFLVN